MDPNVKLNTFFKTNTDDLKCNYLCIETIGSGSFGTVFKAKCQDTNEIVAIKKVFQDRKYKNRELQILNELNHQNVIKIRKYYYTTSSDEQVINHSTNGDDLYLNIVMDYIPDSLSRMIRNYSKSNKEIPEIIIKLISFQLLRAIAYIRSIGICHRDIKPQNILIDQDTVIVKLCDFGSAKVLIRGESNVAYICSRYYRAPELIFNSTDYTTNIDTWSIGCVIAELVLGDPIFKGESSIEQLVEIIKLLGTPSKKQIRAMNPDYNEYKFPIIKCFTLSSLYKNFSNSSPEFIDLISKLLVYNPEKRLSPLVALTHPFFDEIRKLNEYGDKYTYLFDTLFYFSKDEKLDNEDLIRKIVPSWYQEIPIFKI